MNLTYDFQIVGGGFDGAPALAWRDDGKHPPPPAIFVGLCGKGVHCGTSKCRRGETHVSYWLPDEAERPHGTQEYRKQTEHVVRDGDGGLEGRAVYAIGGLLDPRNFGARAHEPVPA